MKTPLILLAFIVQISLTIFPCTTAIVSAKVSRDGRPLLLKNRDSDFEQNSLAYFTDGKYTYIGLINSVDLQRKEVWSGMNSAGFAIMNSASYNLKPESDTTKIADREGILMKLALQTCATVDDFEQLLKSLPKPLGVEANFGIIDAAGGAAYFETNNFGYTKYDVNDPAIAPEGYLIRTNYSFSGDRSAGYGHIRFETASELFTKAYKNNGITASFLLQDVSRCLFHSATKTDLSKNLPADNNDTVYVPFQDYIPRNSTSAVVVIEGIKKGEPVSLTTLWAALGFSLASVAIPVWNVPEIPLPEVVVNNSENPAPVSQQATTIKHNLFSFKGSEKERYINIAGVANKKQTGIRQIVKPIEQRIAEKANEKLNEWRKRGINPSELQSLYKWIDDTVTSEYLSK
ncbi:MAG: hypothetical protein HYV28_10445 [Ignavibacteriales bacterium]|nr:hypothetical protein [Ignavibacteriales bacterium]